MRCGTRRHATAALALATTTAAATTAAAAAAAAAARVSGDTSALDGEGDRGLTMHRARDATARAAHERRAVDT